MSRFEDNQKLLAKVNKELDNLMEEMATVRAEGTGKYDSLMKMARGTFSRLENMETLGDMKALEEIMGSYNRAIALIEEELKNTKETKEENEYSDADIKAYEDLKKVVEDSKKNGKIGKEAQVIEEYEKRQDNEKAIFSQKAAREVRRKREREEAEISELEEPMNEVMETLQENGLYEKYNKLLDFDKGIAQIDKNIQKEEKNKAAKEAQLKKEGLTDEEIKRALEEENENIKNLMELKVQQLIEKDPKCKAIDKEGKKFEDYYTELEDAHKASRDELFAQVEDVFKKNAAKKVKVVENGKIKEVELKDLLKSSTDTIGKVNVIINQKAKIAMHVREKEDKVVDYHKQEKAYEDSLKEEVQEPKELLPKGLFARFAARMNFITKIEGRSGVRAFFGSLFNAKNVEKRIEADRIEQEALAAAKAKYDKKSEYYKKFHNEFKESLKTTKDKEEAKNIAEGKLYNERYNEYKNTYKINKQEDKEQTR